MKLGKLMQSLLDAVSWPNTDAQSRVYVRGPDDVLRPVRAVKVKPGIILGCE